MVPLSVENGGSVRRTTRNLVVPLAAAAVLAAVGLTIPLLARERPGPASAVSTVPPPSAPVAAASSGPVLGPATALSAPSSAAPSSSGPASKAVKPGGPAGGATGSVKGWKLVWQDEFGGSSLSTTKWLAKDNTYVDYDLACISDAGANIAVSGGMARLRVLKQQATCGSESRGYTTAYLTTEGKRSFTYGRFEMRARTPTGPDNSTGLWPAFWLRPDGGGIGEIDVVELPGGAAYYRAATQAIFYDYTPIKQDHRYPFPSGYPADGFHTYTTEWEAGSLRWFIDGVQVYARDRSTTPWLDKAFSRPFHLRLNFQVGGWLGDPTASTKFPAEFEVDYVRVWQRPS
jgi:beta-glucanase (GH16 family)